MGRLDIRWDLVILAIFLIALFWFRFELSTSVESLSYDSYLTLRETEHILETGRPLVEDSLSVTGSLRVGSPVFEYLLATLSFLGSPIYKVLPNLFMILLLVPLYFLVNSFTRSSMWALMSVVLAGTAPSVFAGYLNTPSTIPLALLIFFSILFLLQDPNKHLYWIVGLTLLLTFLSPLIFLLVLTLFITIVILRLEGFGVDARINELFFFTLVLSLWFHVLIYKKALFSQGIGILWQNLPARFAAIQFGTLSFIDVLYGLGVITVLFGVLGAYHALFEVRTRPAFSVIGAILAISVMLFLRLIEIPLGLLILSLLLAVMAGHGLAVSKEYISRTKAPWSVYPLAVVLLFLFVFSAIIPALANAQSAMSDSPSQSDVRAFKLLRAQVPRGAILLTTIREAAAVQYFSGHTTITDHDLLLVEHGEELLRDIDLVYTSRFVVTIIDKAEKHGFTHILFSNHASQEYNRDGLQVGETFCLLSRPIGPDVLLYTVLCEEGE